MSDENKESRSISTNLPKDAAFEASDGTDAVELAKDEELQELLARWNAPDVSPSHERRMIDAYRQQISSQEQRADNISSAAFPQHK